MADKKTNANEDWKLVVPKVNDVREFLEITGDFGEPLEIVREAISNSIDWNASFIEIKFEVRNFKGRSRLFISFLDDGEGMTEKIISEDFWGLGFSNSREDPNKIGEKRHGTKIFLRSQRVEVITKGSEGVFESNCNEPYAALSEGELHTPQVRRRSRFLDNRDEIAHGTKITIIGYNDNVRSKFIQNIVKDYILWFTKIGSVENEFGKKENLDFKVLLQCVNREEPEEITFGYVFPEESYDIDALFDEYSSEAADYYVRKWCFKSCRLKNHPEVTYDSVYYIEGDAVKRKYNQNISSRRNRSSGSYRVADRYGLWVCKDYIPITRKNEWITSFGTGSNAFGLIHGFVNCQKLKLTANRGDISNTEPGVLEELEEAIKQEIRLIDISLKNEGIYFLREQQEIQKSIEQEKAEYESRVNSIKKRSKISIQDVELFEPHNESEVFGFLITLTTLLPDLFEFTPIDYNTSRGIDIIAQNKRADGIRENKYSYIELKYILRSDFNHAFRYLRWIVCWDFSSKITEDTKFTGIKADEDIRKLKIEKDKDGHNIYFLEGVGNVHKIEVIRLREFIKNKLVLEFS